MENKVLPPTYGVLAALLTSRQLESHFPKTHLADLVCSRPPAL